MTDRLTPEELDGMRKLHRRRLPLFPAQLTRLFAEIDALQAELQARYATVEAQANELMMRRIEIATFRNASPCTSVSVEIPAANLKKRKLRKECAE